MDFLSLKQKLIATNQMHLLAHWDQIPTHVQVQLAKQLESLDPAMLLKQRQLVLKPTDYTSVFSQISPFTNCDQKGNSIDNASGKVLIKEGKVGCLVIAGGQGTRLGSMGPKGICPVSVIKLKSLFQLLAEKTDAAGKQAHRKLSLAIMTSPLNHEETLSFFEQHHFFGLLPDQVSFYPQSLLPFLNQDGNLFLESPQSIAFGPSGNGTSILDFYRSGIWQKWHQQGIRYVNFLPIDNPLADPFDAELVGFHARHDLDIAIKCITREDPTERVGILVEREGKAQVIEYTEFPKAEWNARLADGQFKYPIANISLFCFSMDFIQTIGKHQPELPLHPTLKPALMLKNQQVEKTPAWKFETYIFDLLPFAKNIRALLYPRHECFSPLKNLSGAASLTTVQAALQAQDRQLFEKIIQLPAPAHPFELSQEFYYPTQALRQKWHKNTSAASRDYLE